jgi:hypothetical protein
MYIYIIKIKEKRVYRKEGRKEDELMKKRERE